jgi:hypothetical protein
LTEDRERFHERLNNMAEKATRTSHILSATALALETTSRALRTIAREITKPINGK